MNYYQHHIGDFIRDTSRLSDAQCMAYIRMIWMYYESEQPLPDNKRTLAFKIGADESTIELLLESFFRLDGSVWRHKRCDDEIAEYKAICERNKTNGKAGGRPKKTQSVSSGIPDATNSEPSRNPDVTLTSNQEPLNTPIPPAGADIKPEKKTSSVAFQTWVAAVKADGKQVIPDDDPVFDYANQVGIPHEFLRLCWSEFRQRYSQPNAKKYKDWRSVFRKAVRGNWFKLWWVTADGSYELTTVGKQAERAAA